MSEGIRHLKRRFYGQSYQTSLQALLLQRNRANDGVSHRGEGRKRLFGYKLPEWQRPFVWDDKQCAKFIESIWLGVALSPFMVNDSLDTEISLILLDGQQRLTAIDRYWSGEFGVRGEDGNTYLWSELTQAEQMHFLRIPFPWLETNYESEADLRAAYDRHNFGGTAHTVDQRVAGPRTYSDKLTPDQNAAFEQYEAQCGMQPFGIEEFESGAITANELWRRNVRWIENVSASITNMAFPTSNDDIQSTESSAAGSAIHGE